MKTIFTAALFSFFSLAAFSQDNAIDRYFSDLAALEDITSVTMTGSMFQMANKIETEDEESREFLKAAEKIEGLSVLIREKSDNKTEVLKRVEADLNGDFEELLRFSEEDMKAVFFVKESGGIITEMFGVVEASDEWILLDLWGEIDLSQMGKIIDNMELGGLDKSETDAVETATKIKLYPNPVGRDANARIEIPENLVGAQMLIFNGAGKVVREVRLNEETQEVRLFGLPAGKYILKVIEGKDQVYTKKFIIQ